MIHWRLPLYLCIANLIIQYATGAQQKILLCYISSWASYRAGEGKFTIAKDVNPTLCTHFIYSYFGINENTSTIASRDENNDFDSNGQFIEFSQLKEVAPNVKLMISIGGWAEGSKKFSDLAASSVKVQTFVNSIIAFVKKYKLDGVDISWQFPTRRGGIPEDKRNFATLLKELRDKLKVENKLLSVHVSGKRYVIDQAYDYKVISNKADFINVMTYEYNGPWDEKTVINAPLTAHNDFSTTFSIDYMLKKGVPREKILVGIPTYGHAFTMKNTPPDGNYLNVSSDTGYKSQWMQGTGFISYKEVCYNLLTTSGWKEMWDKATSTPYAVNNKKFVSYDNVRSSLEKAKLVNLKELGGVSIFTMDTDDFNGICNGDKYPIIRAIKKYLDEGESKKDKPPITVSNSTIVTHNYG